MRSILFSIICVILLTHSAEGQELVVRNEFNDAAKSFSIKQYWKQERSQGRSTKHIKLNAIVTYWVAYVGDSSALSADAAILRDRILSNLAFTSNGRPKPSLQDTVKTTVFSSLVYNCENDSLMASLSEDKNVYYNSLPSAALYKAAKQVGAKYIFHIMNLFDNWPFFIITNDNEIFVHYQFIKKGDRNFTYRTVSFEEFVSSASIKVTSINLQTWR